MRVEPGCHLPQLHCTPLGLHCCCLDASGVHSASRHMCTWKREFAGQPWSHDEWVPVDTCLPGFCASVDNSDILHVFSSFQQGVSCGRVPSWGGADPTRVSGQRLEPGGASGGQWAAFWMRCAGRGPVVPWAAVPSSRLPFPAFGPLALDQVQTVRMTCSGRSSEPWGGGGGGPCSQCGQRLRGGLPETSPQHLPGGSHKAQTPRPTPSHLTRLGALTPVCLGEGGPCDHLGYTADLAGCPSCPRTPLLSLDPRQPSHPRPQRGSSSSQEEGRRCPPHAARRPRASLSGP